MTRASVDGVVAGVAIAATWVLFATVLAGAGSLIGRWVMGGRRLSLQSSLWLGLAIFLAYVAAVHLVMPADQRTWLPFLLLALVELVLSRRQIGQAIKFGASRIRTPLVGTGCGIGVAVTLWIANLSVQPPLHYDSGLYHLQAISWARDYPVVTGLANLHFRLGYTSAWWPFSSSLGVGPWRGHESHLPTGFVVTLLVVTLLSIVIGALARRRYGGGELLAILLLPVSLSQLAFGWVSSPANDQPAYVFTVMLAVFGIRALSGTAQAVPVALALAITTALVRIQFAPFAILLSLAILIFWWRRSSFAQIRRPAIAFLCLGLVSGAVHIAQGVIASGYPLFPLPVAAMPVSWRIPTEVADSSAADVANYARLSPGGTDGWTWLAPWVTTNFGNTPTFTYGLGLLLAGIAVIIVNLFVSRSPYRVELQPVLLVAAAATVNVFLWFLTAPDPRYGMGVIWVAAGCVTIIATARLTAGKWPLLFLACLLGLSLQTVLALWGSGQFSIVAAGGSGPFGVVAPPIAATTRLGSNPSYLVPVTGDQCWDAPIPCTDFPHPDLKQRGDSLGDGFFTQGAGEAP